MPDLAPDKGDTRINCWLGLIKIAEAVWGDAALELPCSGPRHPSIAIGWDLAPLMPFGALDLIPRARNLEFRVMDVLSECDLAFGAGNVQPVVTDEMEGPFQEMEWMFQGPG